MEDAIEQRSSEPECEDFEPDMDVQYQEDAVNAPEGVPLARKAVFSSKSRAEGVRKSKEKMEFNPKLLDRFKWAWYDTLKRGMFCSYCEKFGTVSQSSGGVWRDSPFSNWKKAWEKSRAHEKTQVHKLASERALAAENARRHGSVIELCRSSVAKEKALNQDVIKKLIRCVYFLAKNRLPHTTTYTELVDVVIECGGEAVRKFMAEASKNATYLSAVRLTQLIAVIAEWQEKQLLERLQKASVLTILADESTDITTMEEMSICFRWVENGEAVEHFLEVIHLKRTDAETITTALQDYMKLKHINPACIIGMGFDGAATFSGRNLVSRHV